MQENKLNPTYIGSYHDHDQHKYSYSYMNLTLIEDTLIYFFLRKKKGRDDYTLKSIKMKIQYVWKILVYSNLNIWKNKLPIIMKTYDFHHSHGKIIILIWCAYVSLMRNLKQQLF